MKNGVLVCSCGRTCCETAIEQYALDEECVFCREERRSREPMKKPTCETCDYYEPENAALGNCHKTSAGKFERWFNEKGTELYNRNPFPWVMYDDWCGEHQDFPKWQVFKNE
jgi:hypothetical protein